MILPLVLLLASAAFGTPAAFTENLETQLSQNPETLGTYVRQYFADEPILADIAWCESRMRHLDKNGDILRGKVVPEDIGVMQINTRYHEKKAKELGIDLYSLNGNLAYARYLYEKEGTKPWMASSPCWGRLAQK